MFRILMDSFISALAEISKFKSSEILLLVEESAVKLIAPRGKLVSVPATCDSSAIGKHIFLNRKYATDYFNKDLWGGDAFECDIDTKKDHFIAMAYKTIATFQGRRHIGYDASQWIADASTPEKCLGEVDVATFKDMVNGVKSTRGYSEEDSTLSAFHFVFSGSELNLITRDEYRFSQQSTEFISEPSQFLVDGDDIEAMVKALPKDGTLNLYADGINLVVITDSSRFTLTGIEGTFPNVNRLIPNNTVKTVVYTSELTRILKALKNTAKENANRITVNVRGVNSWNLGTFEVTAKNFITESTQMIDSYTEASFECDINLAFLLESLDKVTKKQANEHQTTIEYATAMRGVLIVRSGKKTSLIITLDKEE